MTDIRDVLCGEHKVPLEGPADVKPEHRYSCPVCGVGDTYENVFREVGDYAKEKTAEHFEEMMSGIAKGSKMMTFTPATRPKRSYRFIINLDLHNAAP